MREFKNKKAREFFLASLELDQYRNINVVIKFKYI